LAACFDAVAQHAHLHVQCSASTGCQVARQAAKSVRIRTAVRAAVAMLLATMELGSHQYGPFSNIVNAGRVG
jgi:hypothetical protein